MPQPPDPLPDPLLRPGVRERLDQNRGRPVVLSVRDLEKRFEGADGSFLALRGLHLEVRHREFICVIGRSGCGKSTLIRIIAGLEEPTGGEIRLDGAPVHGPGPDRGMVFQAYTLFPWLTVRGNVVFGLKMAGAERHRAEYEAMRWIELVGLGGFANHYPDQLSGGMKQRVAIARALASRPRILLMDEPFGALDSQTRTRMQGYLLKICRKVDVTVVFITHDLDEAIFLADRVVVLPPRPGPVQHIMDVPVPRPRRPEHLLDPAFLAARRHLDSFIHEDEPDGEPEVPVHDTAGPLGETLEF